MVLSSLLGALGAVLRPALLAVGDAGGVEGAADDVVAQPGRSLTRPPRMSTTECSCRLWPSPGMYEVTSMPLVNRTRATLRSAEFGFLGVEV